LPELPDITVYLDALERYIVGHRLVDIRLASPFVLRSVDPPLSAVNGTVVTGVSRQGKRIVIGLEGDHFLVIHLMIAGRLRWRDAGSNIPGKVGLAAFDFDHGTMVLTEAGSRKRASLHLVQGAEALAQFDRGGLDVFETDLATFSSRLQFQNRTLKRALTDPRILDGIGNAYSDEILHRARLSPVKRTQSLSPEELERLLHAARDSLADMDRTAPAGGRRRVSRQGHRLPARYGCPRPVW